MRISFCRASSALLLACSLGVLTLSGNAGAAVNVGGHAYEETATVAGQELRLNGAGIRYKAVFAVYSAGLYLRAPRKTPADIYADTGVKRIRMVMQRRIGSEELGQAFLAGIRKNAGREDRTRLTGQLLKFGELFGSIPEMQKADVLTIDFLPGAGTLIQINGKQITEIIPDPLFYTVLLKIWLGDAPADSFLKNALLGEEARQ